MLPSSTVTNSAYSFVSNYQAKCSLRLQATVKRLGKLDAGAIPCPPSLSLGARILAREERIASMYLNFK